ncbi:hypothetical protein PXK00_12340 [Phaeobacter sp. QD34_3]|uniref:hypothetical protein n=1 Tax=unclassified Phaeobacter TaxID=2621772 RepID=UPI00237FD3D6|nr:MULTISPECIES: hypothetical protein [unclassified Phaeobacter]MDE4133903.1 hypothetical protein [Phaeobacter sp. QD34_3]MDE4137640.1 hypothetical protein [Phaeobacter sp. QD34_24]
MAIDVRKLPFNLGIAGMRFAGRMSGAKNVQGAMHGLNAGAQGLQGILATVLLACRQFCKAAEVGQGCGLQIPNR